MAFTSLKDGGLSVKVGCASDWTGGTEVSSYIHGLKYGSGINGIGPGSFWYEVSDPFASAYSYMRHGARVNISHTVDATTTYLYKGYIISDPRRGYAGENARVQVELGGPMEVAKWRTDCAFTFTDTDTSECWVINKRNNKVYNVVNDDSIEIQVEKGEKVPSNGRAGIIGYVAYLGCGYMGGAGTNQLNNVKRIDGQVTTRLGDNMRAKLLVADSYTDEREVAASVYTSIKTWGDTEGERKLNQKYFDSNDFWSPTGAGKKYLALALYCTDVAGDNKVMTADRYVRLDNVRVYTGTISRRIDEALVIVADWVNLHNTEVTSNIRSVIPNLVARPYCDPVSAMNQFATQAETLVEWGWWATKSSNGIEYRAQEMLTNHTTIRNSGRCFLVDATVPGIHWDVRPRPEDGGDVRAVRLLYGKQGRSSDFPGGTPASAIGPADPGLSNALGPFLGATANVTTVDFTARNFSDEVAKRIARSLGRKLRNANPVSGTINVVGALSPGTAGLTRESDSSAYPWVYVQGGDFIESSQEPVNGRNPLVVTSIEVDVDRESVDMEVGMPSDALMRQLEQAGSVRRAKLHRR